MLSSRHELVSWDARVREATVLFTFGSSNGRSQRK